MSNPRQDAAGCSQAPRPGADPPGHEPRSCLFDNDRGPERTTVFVETVDMGASVLADLCHHAGTHTSGLPAPQEGAWAFIEPCWGFTSFPTGDDVFDRAVSNVTSEQAYADIVSTANGEPNPRGTLAVVDSVYLAMRARGLFARTSVHWTLRQRPYPRVENFGVGPHWLVIQAIAGHRDWRAWWIRTSGGGVTRKDLSEVLEGRFRRIWRKEITARMLD